jgi:hypothetical protein
VASVLEATCPLHPILITTSRTGTSLVFILQGRTLHLERGYDLLGVHSESLMEPGSQAYRKEEVPRKETSFSQTLP